MNIFFGSTWSLLFATMSTFNEYLKPSFFASTNCLKITFHMKYVFASCFQHHRKFFVNMLFFITIKRQSLVLNTNVNYENNVFWLASLINFTFLPFLENQEKTVIWFHWKSVNFDSFIASKVHHKTPSTFTRKNKAMQFKKLKEKEKFFKAFGICLSTRLQSILWWF